MTRAARERKEKEEKEDGDTQWRPYNVAVPKGPAFCFLNYYLVRVLRPRL